MSAKGTRATDELRRAGVPYTTHEYEPPVRHGRARDDRPSYGLDAVAALGIGPDRIFKTLVAVVDDRPACAVVPVDAELDLKALADALGARRARMAEPADAEKATGYVIGGISPVGQRRRIPIAIDRSALEHASILVSAGRRGLQVELAPIDLANVTGAVWASIARKA